MRSPFFTTVGFLLAMCFAQSALAEDTCTIMYGVDATLDVSDTDLGKGDVSVQGVRGSLVVEYPQGEQGQVVDGKVRVLHYAMYESFKIDTVVNITTTIHHFTPTCNGSDEPTWRRTSDEGFPAACGYAGNERPVAIGVLRKDDNAIEWGGLNRGDNPQFDVWTQPLVHGPPGSDHSVAISTDLSTMRTPVYRSDGRQSYNLPNSAPSRTWFSFVATRNHSSPFTTCP